METISSSDYRRSKKAAKGKTMARRVAKRDASEPEIVSALEQCGFSVFRLDQPTDLLVGFRGRCWLVECKSGTTGYGKGLNASQRAFAASWRGPDVVVLRTAQDATDWAVSIASQHERERTQLDNELRDAFDDFLDAQAEAEKTGDTGHVVIAGRLYVRFMKIRDARR